jgi:hypothetical protein
MGVFDDLGKAFNLGKGLANKAMNETENTCAQVLFTCPCGLEQTFPLNEWTPEQLTEVFKTHAATCDKASGQ